MSDKPEALRLADALDQGTYLLSRDRNATVAILRDQHAEMQRLRAEEKRLICIIKELAAEHDALRAALERFSAGWRAWSEAKGE